MMMMINMVMLKKPRMTMISLSKCEYEINEICYLSEETFISCLYIYIGMRKNM